MTDDSQDDPNKDSVQTNIRNTVFLATQTAVNAKIEEEKDKVRHGEGFWGAIKAFFFRIAEYFGFERGLAKLLGSPIPEKDEVKAVSSQVAEAVSATLTDKNFQYGNRKEFEEGLRKSILDNLARNHATIPSFSEAQIVQVATEAAGNVGNEFANLFDAKGNTIVNPFSLSAADTMVAQEFATAFGGIDSDKKKQLAELAGRDTLTSTNINAIAKVLAHQLGVIEAQKEAWVKQGGSAYEVVAGQLRETLVGNATIVNGGGQMKLSSAGLAVLADEIAVSLVRDRIGVTEAIPGEFQQTMDARRKEAVQEVVEAKISGTVQDAIRTQSAVGAVEAYRASEKDTSWLGSAKKMITHAIDKESIEVMEAYYKKDTEDHYQRKSDTELTSDQVRNLPKLKKVEEKLQVFAAATHQSLTTEQSKAVGEIVGHAVMETINDPSNAALDRDQMGDRLEVAIRKRLNAETETEDFRKIAPDNSIDTINKTRGGDILQIIAEEFAEAIRNNKNQAYDQLNQAQSLLKDPNGVAFNDRDITSALTAAGVQHNVAPGLKPGHFVGPAGATPSTIPLTNGQTV